MRSAASGTARRPQRQAHPRVKSHFAPTSASWMNMVEMSFSILDGQTTMSASHVGYWPVSARSSAQRDLVAGPDL